MNTFKEISRALRFFARQPGWTLVVVLTLAIGIGAVTAMWTYLAGLYWTEVRAPQPDRLFAVRSGTREAPGGQGFSYLDYLDARADLVKFGDLQAWSTFAANVRIAGGDADQQGQSFYVFGDAVTPGFFPLFGTDFMHGRNFLPDEDGRPGSPRVVVLSHLFWSQHFGADPEAVGQTLRINGHAYTIIGILPRSFQGYGVVHRIYIPLAHLDDTAIRPQLQSREIRRVFCMIRLRDEIHREQLAGQLASLAQHLDQVASLPSGPRQFTTSRLDELGETPQTKEHVLACAVLFLLVLACANVANLLLARMVGRQREVAVRTAIGASRFHLLRQLLTESLLLALAGGTLGIGFAYVLVGQIRDHLTAVPVGLAGWAEGTEFLPIDGRVLLFTLLASLLTSGLFGLAPVLFAWRTNLVSALKGEVLGSRTGRMLDGRQLLVVAQLTLSTVLLLGAGLLAHNLFTLAQVDLGFTTDQLFLVTISGSPQQAISSDERRARNTQLYEMARQHLSTLPGVEAVTLAGDVPASGHSQQTNIALPGREDQPFAVDEATIGRDYFRVLGIPLRRGRVFDERDQAGGLGVVIVNEALASRYWPGEDPIGRTLRLTESRPEIPSQELRVVGVVADTHHRSRTVLPAPMIYVPFPQRFRQRATLIGRAAGPPAGHLQSARQAVSSLHPDLAFVDAGTYDRQFKVDIWEQRFTSSLATMFAGLGLLLASSGLYSLMNYAVNQRLRELGIRMAVGASTRDLERLLIQEAMRLAAWGIGLGLAVVLALARLLASLIPNISVYDHWTFLLVPVLLGLIFAAASWVPALRAGQVDPWVVLHGD